MRNRLRRIRIEAGIAALILLFAPLFLLPGWYAALASAAGFISCIVVANLQARETLRCPACGAPPQFPWPKNAADRRCNRCDYDLGAASTGDAGNK